MTGTLLFIHGTGVRTAGYNQTIADMKKGMAKADLGGVAIEGLPWGETLGTKLDDEAIDAVLPPAKVRAVGAVPDDADWQAALWAELLRDPLFELRMATVRQAPAAAPSGRVVLPGGPVQPEAQIQSHIDSLRQTVADPLPGGVTAEDIRAAAQWLSGQPLITQAAAAAGDAEDTDLIQAVARAVVAKVLTDQRGETGVGPDALYLADARRALVAAVAAALAPPTRGLGGWLFNSVKDFAEAQATAYGKNRRHDLMHGISPGFGDILLYQRRGDEILAAIETKILGLAQAGSPVVVLGHSLGGIMVVDLLSRPRPAGPLPVARLITIASQSPMFLKCDALGSMRLNAALPAGTPYTPWLNIFDRNDFLSFCAGRAFPGVTHGIEDFEVASRVPFPNSHGAYFRMEEVYAKIAREWP